MGTIFSILEYPIVTFQVKKYLSIRSISDTRYIQANNTSNNIVTINIAYCSTVVD